MNQEALDLVRGYTPDARGGGTVHVHLAGMLGLELLKAASVRLVVEDDGGLARDEVDTVGVTGQDLAGLNHQGELTLFEQGAAFRLG